MVWVPFERSPPELIEQDEQRRGRRMRWLRRQWYRHVLKRLDKYGWPTIGALAVGALVLGYLGFEQHHEQGGDGILDNAYRSVQLFVLQSGDVDPPIPLLLELGRWLAWLVTTVVAVVAVLALLRDRVARLRGARAKNHVVICGLGRCGVRLAIGFRSRGEKVVGIERSASAPGIEACRREGVIVVAGDGMQATILRQAGIRRARRLIAVCGDDGVNVDVIVKAHDLTDRDRARPLDCYAHVADPDLREFIREFAVRSPKARVLRINSFDVSERGAPSLLREDALFHEDGATPHPPSHIGVVGLGQTGSHIVLTLAERLRTTTHAPARRVPVTILDRNADKLTEALRRRHPQVDERLELMPRAVDVDSPLFPTASLRANLADPDGVTSLYICLDEDVRGLRAALILRKALDPKPVPIVVRTTEHASRSPFTDELGESPVNVHIVHMLDRACTPDDILLGTNEAIARAIHEEYLRSEKARGESPRTNPSMVPWDELPEPLKDSSRDQASHVGAKLREIGCDIRTFADHTQTTPVTFTDSEVERLARMEHVRWFEERLAAGWKLGSRKDVERKKSPDLVPWEELSDEARERDRVLVRGLPDFLATAGFAIVRRDVTADDGQDPAGATASPSRSAVETT